MPSGRIPHLSFTMPLADRTAAPRSEVSFDDIDELLHEIAQLAQSQVSTSEFAEAVCQHTQRVLTGGEVAVWICGHDGSWKQLANSTVASGEGARRTLGSGPTAAIAKFDVDRTCAGAVEIVPGSGVPPGVIEAIAELTGDFFCRARLGELHEIEQKWKLLGEVALRLHANLNVQETSYRIANEGRDWIGCDRLSLLAVESGSLHTLAMSGIDRVERRAAAVQSLERFSAQVMQIREPIWYGLESKELPPEIDAPLHAFLDQAPAKVVGAVPLIHGDQCIAVLVAECLVRSPDADELRERLPRFVAHATSALFNARQHERIPFARQFDRAQSADRLWWTRRTAAAALVMGALAAVFTFVPADFSVEARGELQPRERREVFSPDEGVISQVNVSHGSVVRQGEPLLILTSAELDYELARVRGEIETTRTRLVAARTRQLEAGRSITLKPEEILQLAADEQELKVLLESLEKQQAILKQREQALTVTSPLAGKVLTWNVEPLLASRPVTRGQPLMTVANVDADWQLDLHLPDDRVGHVLTAQAASDEQPLISYVLATDPKRVLQTRVEKLAQASEFDERGEMTVALTAPVHPYDIAEPRPGAEVIARIHCGRRSLGFVWFHDLVSAVRAWLYL